MMYEDLENIPLSNFIEVFMGNLKALGEDCPKGEAARIAEYMINEYVTIVGGRQLLSEISKSNELINLNIKIDCLEACKNLMKLGDWKSVCDVLSKFGYGMFPENKGGIRKKVDSVLASSRYRRDTLSQTRRESPRMDRDYFTRERVTVMSHFKMHIDKNSYTAKEYAYLVKRMCDDIELMNRKNK